LEANENCGGAFGLNRRGLEVGYGCRVGGLRSRGHGVPCPYSDDSDGEGGLNGEVCGWVRNVGGAGGSETRPYWMLGGGWAELCCGRRLERRVAGPSFGAWCHGARIKLAFGKYSCRHMTSTKKGRGLEPVLKDTSARAGRGRGAAVTERLRCGDVWRGVRCALDCRVDLWGADSWRLVESGQGRRRPVCGVLRLPA